jgi:hypothetical protein
MAFPTAIPGSRRHYGMLARFVEYGRYIVLNWATKFFIDALLMREPNPLRQYLA